MAPVYVFLGGGLGSLCRYAIGSLFPEASSHYGTLMANFLACLTLGILMGLSGKGLMQDHHKLLLMTGFCGGFSTFSTFSYELVKLNDNSGILLAFCHMALSIIVGVSAILAGLWLSGVVQQR